MSDFNPFEAPSEKYFVSGSTPHERHEVLIKFRQQMTALGGLWTFFGVLSLVAVIALTVLSDPIPNPELQSFPNPELQSFLVAVLGSSSVLWLTVGIATCFKQMWAVYVGLGISYLGLLSSILQLNLCGLAILIVIIIQAHRVLGFAKQLRASGVPLDSKP